MNFVIERRASKIKFKPKPSLNFFCKLPSRQKRLPVRFNYRCTIHPGMTDELVVGHHYKRLLLLGMLYGDEQHYLQRFAELR